MNFAAKIEPDPMSDLDVRLCRIHVVRPRTVGNNMSWGLPCLGLRNLEEGELYYQANMSGPSVFDNAGQVLLDRLCPSQHPDDDGRSNSFTVRAVYELPDQRDAIDALSKSIAHFSRA